MSNVPVERHQRGLDLQLSGRRAHPDLDLPGPIFGERARPWAGAGCSRALPAPACTSRPSGAWISHLRFTFTHANSDFPGCDSIAGGDCSLLGVPALENETIDLNLALDVRLTVTSFLLTYGVSDRIDVGVVLPVVSVSLAGTSNAQINPSVRRPRCTSSAARRTIPFSPPTGRSMGPPPVWATLMAGSR